MKKWSTLLTAMLFVSAVVLLPAVHEVALGSCCNDGCTGKSGDGAEDSSRTPAESDHDASTCPVCKVAGTPLLWPSTIAVVDTLYRTRGSSCALVLAPSPTVLVGCRGARAPPP